MDDWKTIKTKREAENMRKNARMARKVSWICVILGFGSVSGQLAVRVAQELDILVGHAEKRLPMLSSYFPYDDKPTPIYEITWFIQYLAAGLATLVYSGIYCLFVGLMLHLRGQVANLRLILETLEPNRNCVKRVVQTDWRKKIGFIIERHESLNRFVQGIESIFNLMFLAEISSCTVQICLQLFLLVSLLSEKDMPLIQILFMIIYVMHVGTHLYICCYVAEKVREESLLVCQSVYNYQWYNLSAKDARMLIIVMHRAEKPLVVTAGKIFTFSLQLYAQVLKTSGGYLSMLLAVKDPDRVRSS